MKSMLISEFKAKCIAVLKEVQRSGDPVVVTLRGQPLVRVEPVGNAVHRKQLGTLKGSLQIRRNLVGSDTSADWEMLK